MADYEKIQPPFFLALLPATQSALKAKPLLASTLASFTTGSAEPSEQHKAWLQTEVANLLKSRPGCWVDLVGHASRRWRGVHQSNFPLSAGRCQRVEQVIQDAMPGVAVEVFHNQPKGASESGPNASDDSPQFRSVEVLVYGPEIPKPRQPPDNQTRQIYRRTFEKRDDTRTADDIGDGTVPGAIGQLIIIVPKAIKDEERIKRHPVEMGDPDYGEVQEARSASVDKRFVMVQAMVDCNSVVERTSGPGPLQNYHYEITREYRFIYGVGSPDQKVIVFKHKKTVWKDGRLYSDFHETHYVDQSPDYTDP